MAQRYLGTLVSSAISSSIGPQRCPRLPWACIPCSNVLLSRSLMVRLHEALKQCQDLKTEKGQMDRKINQLSEENGDLSFKVTGCCVFSVSPQPSCLWWEPGEGFGGSAGRLHLV